MHDSSRVRSRKRESPKAPKLALFRRLFKGRLDVFPRRFESAVSGKVGYAPACRNDFVKGICGKPNIKCGQCTNQAFIPVDDAAVLAHLTGTETGKTKKAKDQDFTMGVYPLLPDETCWFVAADFDKADWLLNVTAYRDSARNLGIPVAIERYRSANARVRRNATLGWWLARRVLLLKHGRCCGRQLPGVDLRPRLGAQLRVGPFVVCWHPQTPPPRCIRFPIAAPALLQLNCNVDPFSRCPKQQYPRKLLIY
jgi:hypothetical protein